MKTLYPMNQNTTPSRGKSLENDLRQLLYEEKFFDITLRCSDGIDLGANKNILAARSDVFYKLILNRSNKKIDLHVEFNKINSMAMKFILEYLYTSTISEEAYNIDNIIEFYYAAKFFELDGLKKHIIDITKTFNDSKKILSKYVEKFPSLKTKDEMSQLLVGSVAKTRLIPYQENDSLSLIGLRYLLKNTLDASQPFATYEIDLFDYIISKIDRDLSESLEFKNNVEYKDSTAFHQQLKDHFVPLIPYIDLRRIDSDILVNGIEPLKLFSSRIFTDVYRFKAQENNELRSIRGIPIFKWKDDNDSLIISNDGFAIEAKEHLNTFTSQTTNFKIMGKGIYEWDIVIEKLNRPVYIGICEHDKSHECDNQVYCGWVLCSDGYAYHKKSWKWHNARFREGDVVTVHLNMTEKICTFFINNFKFVISEWKIPSEVYPIVSLKRGSKLCILESR